MPVILCCIRAATHQVLIPTPLHLQGLQVTHPLLQFSNLLVLCHKHASLLLHAQPSCQSTHNSGAA